MTKPRVLLSALVTAGAIVIVAVVGWPPDGPSPARSQSPDVELNVRPGTTKRINIAVPDFAVVSGTDTQNWAKRLPGITAADLTFTSLFSVVSGSPPLPVGGAEAVRPRLAELAAAGGVQALQGLLTVRADRFEVEMRLYDLTSSDFRIIGTKKVIAHISEPRRAAHRVADEVVLLDTGEAGVADTKMAYVVGPPGSKELVVADYDGAAAANATRNASINLSPAWSPDARSIAFTSFMNGYPDLFRLFPFERQRPVQTLASFVGINSSPGWSPDGRYLALTLSKDGNPEIYVLTLATGVLQRLTRHAGIDTEPTWSPSGQQIAFVSDRAGQPRIFVMDKDGGNVRQLTSGGFHTQPRWSPKGDPIVYTQRSGTHDLWAISPGGSSPRQLTSGQGDNQSATWAPDGRHLAFQSNRTGRWQLYFMTVDGQTTTQVTQGTNEATSPSWSPRLP